KGWLAWVSIALSLAFFIGMYKFVALLVTTKLRSIYPVMDNRGGVGVVDGLIRLAIFLALIWLMSRAKDIRRIFEYHGAEHKTVFAFESGQPVTVENTQKFPTWHPRCGTSFLITVMLISIPIYMLFPKMVFWQAFA